MGYLKDRSGVRPKIKKWDHILRNIINLSGFSYILPSGREWAIRQVHKRSEAQGEKGGQHKASSWVPAYTSEGILHCLVLQN